MQLYYPVCEVATLTAYHSKYIINLPIYPRAHLKMWATCLEMTWLVVLPITYWLERGQYHH